MKIPGKYLPEYLLVVTVMLVSVLGFWEIYLGAGADPQPRHHLHLLTTFLWLGLLLFQLSLIGRAKYRKHRNVGLAVLVAAPLLVATTAMLSVHSAHRGLVSGEGDELIVQNVMVTIELGLLILFAFILRKNRKLHASFLLSTTIIFLGIALFFTLWKFVPLLTNQAPETFDPESAGILGQIISPSLGLLFFLKDFRNGWPFLLAGLSFFLNEVIRSWLAGQDLIQPLTEFVGSLNTAMTFIGAFVVLSASLAATGLKIPRRRAAIEAVPGS